MAWTQFSSKQCHSSRQGGDARQVLPLAPVQSLLLLPAEGSNYRKSNCLCLIIFCLLLFFVLGLFCLFWRSLLLYPKSRGEREPFSSWFNLFDLFLHTWTSGIQEDIGQISTEALMKTVPSYQTVSLCSITLIFQQHLEEKATGKASLDTCSPDCGSADESVSGRSLCFGHTGRFRWQRIQGVKLNGLSADSLVEVITTSHQISMPP